MLLAILGPYLIYRFVINYGLQNVLTEIQGASYYIFFLPLAFIPTLFLYSLAWHLVTSDERGSLKLTLRSFFHFVQMMIVSIAWNNLTPFLKVGGEPAKYFMLRKIVSSRKALQSTILYNVVHLYSTLLAIVVTALIVPFLFEVPVHFRKVLWGGATAVILVVFSLHYFEKLLRPVTFSFLRSGILKVKWSLRQLRHYYKKNKNYVLLALLFDGGARFVEGITYYLAFLLISKPTSFLVCAFLETTRTFVDTLFFFVPYQLGTREEGLRYFTETVLGVGSAGLISVALLYRLIEVAWTALGYILWIKLGSKDNSLKVKSEKDFAK